MKTIGLAALTLACLVFAGGADAAEAGFYAGIDAGVVEPTVGKSDSLLASLPGMPIEILSQEARSNGSQTGWSVVLGYRINRYLAGELAYTDFGAIDVVEDFELSASSPFPLVVLESTSRISGPSLSVRGILPIADGFEAFVRAGLLLADQEVQHNLSNFIRTNAEELWIVGIGLDAKLSQRLSARFEFQSSDRFPRGPAIGPMALERFGFGLTYDF